MPNYPNLKQVDLVALDLDGTVICSRGEQPISERTRNAIRKVLEAGVRVTFVTGRTEDYASPIAREFGLTEPLVTYNGARIYSLINTRIIYEAKIGTGVSVQLAHWLQARELVVACYLNRGGKLHLIQTHSSGKPEYDDYLFGKPRHEVGDMSEEIASSQSSVSKMIVMTRDPLESELLEQFGPAFHPVRTHEELIEILPPGVSKGSGVRRLCELLEVKPERVLAVGDQANDIATFQECGFSVAMADAPEAVREAAQFITESFAEDGCARALERLFSETEPQL